MSSKIKKLSPANSTTGLPTTGRFRRTSTPSIRSELAQFGALWLSKQLEIIARFESVTNHAQMT